MYSFYSSFILKITQNLLDWKGELEHRRVKRFYARTNKTKTFVTQISKHFRRERILRKISQRAEKEAANNNSFLPGSGDTTSDLLLSDPLPLTPPEAHHHISNTQQFYENIPRWLDEHDGDLALIVSSFFITFSLHSLISFSGISSEA